MVWARLDVPSTMAASTTWPWPEPRRPHAAGAEASEGAAARPPQPEPAAPARLSLEVELDEAASPGSLLTGVPVLRGARTFDPHHVGAQVGQHQGRVRTRPHPRH